jgi:hypothetical protein
VAIRSARAAVLASFLKLHALFQAQPAVFLDKNTKVICQGMTGKNGTFHTEQVTKATCLVQDHVRRRQVSHNHLETALVSHAVIHAEPYPFDRTPNQATQLGPLA